MKQNHRKTSRERTDIFYKSDRKPLSLNAKNTVLGVIVILIMLFLAYQLGYSVGKTSL